MTHALVTGGAGFIGCHVTGRLLEEGYDVVVLDDFSTGADDNLLRLDHRDRLTVVRDDVSRPISIDGDIEAIYHLACPASPVHYQSDAARTIRTAVDGTRSVLDLARKTGARVVVASTSEVYGEPEVHPQREDYWGNVNPIGPRACYDEGKRCAEALCVAYAQQYGVDVRIARIFNTYGPMMRADDGRVVSNFVLQALERQPLTIYGDGRQTRSFCFISDMVEALTRLMNHPSERGPINLGNPEERTIAEIAALVLRMTGSEAGYELRPLPGDDPTRRQPDIDRARRILRWQPTVSLEAGLAATIEDLRHRYIDPRRSAMATGVWP